MKNITCSKEELISKLKHNREKHLNEYHKALAGWREEFKKELEKRLELLRTGDYEKASEYFSDRPPSSHTNEYDTALEMLSYHQNDNIDIDNETFRKYVLNEWDWRATWMASNSKYIQR